MVLTLVLPCIGVLWICLWAFHIYPAWIRSPLISGARGRFAGRITVVIPARNEEHNLPVLLASMKGHGPSDMEIIVVNDHSTDGTAACVRSAMREDGRISLLECAELPEDWAGKTWALTQGVGKSHGDWLIFCDADVIMESDAIALAAGLVEQERLDCLSLLPRMENRNLAVASLLASFAMTRALLFSPAAPGKKGLIQGAFLMIRRSALEAVGGFRQIRKSVLEDVDLGYLLHGAGFRVSAVPARSILHTRMYGSFGEAVDGMSKHMFAVLRFSFAGVLVVSLAQCVMVLFPVLWFLAALLAEAGVWFIPAHSLGAGLLAILPMYAVFFAIVRSERLPALSALAVPLFLLPLALILCRSVCGYISGGITWKGRRYSRY